MRITFWLLGMALFIPSGLKADVPYVLATRKQGELRAYDEGNGVRLELRCTEGEAATFTCEVDPYNFKVGTRAWCGGFPMTATIQYTTCGDCKTSFSIWSKNKISLRGELVRTGNLKPFRDPLGHSVPSFN